MCGAIVYRFTIRILREGTAVSARSLSTQFLNKFTHLWQILQQDDDRLVEGSASAITDGDRKITNAQ